MMNNSHNNPNNTTIPNDTNQNHTTSSTIYNNNSNSADNIQSPNTQPRTSQPSTSPASTTETGAANKKKKRSAPKRKKVAQACVYCRRSHMTCDESRPCQRCIKRGIGHKCHDAVPKPPKNASLGGGVHGHQNFDRPLPYIKPNIPIAQIRSQPQQHHDPRISAQSIGGGVVQPHQVTRAATSMSLPTATTNINTTIGSSSQQPYSPSMLEANNNNNNGGGGIMSKSRFDSPVSITNAGTNNDNTTTTSDILKTTSNGDGDVEGEDGIKQSTVPLQHITPPINPQMGTQPPYNFASEQGIDEFNMLNIFLESLRDNFGINDLTTNTGTTADFNKSVGELPNTGSFELNPPSVTSAVTEVNVSSILSGPLQQQSSMVSSCNNNNNNNDSGGIRLSSQQLFQFQQQPQPQPQGQIFSKEHDNLLSIISNQQRQQLLLEQQQQQQQQLHDDSTSVTTSKDGEISITDRFFFTAADPSDGSSEDKIRQYISAKFQAGFLKPYNYVNGYSRMQHFMETNMSQPSIIRILTTLETFRPTFRAIAQSLRDFDLLLVEEGFERMLLDYDHVFNSFGTPACLWRRTGEIYKANREFADLVGIPLHYFRDGRIGIYELLTEDSTVNYWEQYGKIAFDTSQKAVLTSCVLQCSVGLKERVQHDELSASSGGGGNNNNNNSGGGGGGNFGSPRKLSSSGAGGGNGNYNNHHNHHHNYPHPHPHHGVSSPSASSVTSSSLLLGRGIRCCFSFTIRRDKYKIPVAIIGNFMPTKPKDIQRQIIES